MKGVWGLIAPPSSAEHSTVMARVASFRHYLARKCKISTSSFYGKNNEPRSGDEMPRSGGLSSMYRLPVQEGEPEGLDACIVGIPMDHGCSYRSGARLGPRAIRAESMRIHPLNITGAAPFGSLQVADIGDVPINAYNLQKTVDIITTFYRRIMKADCTPLTLGGDHTLTWPILRAAKEKYGAVGLIQVDAHADLGDLLFGEKITHGSWVKRALEDGLTSPEHMIQIGLRGQLYSKDEYDEVYKWAENQGIKMVFADECWNKSLTPLMEVVRKQMKDIPVYLTFDIDGIEPLNCPGTGTTEVGGLTPVQALEVVRGCRGLNLIGADVVEVSPMYDQTGATAMMAANLIFEMLCVLPRVQYYDLSWHKRVHF